MYSMQQRI